MDKQLTEQEHNYIVQTLMQRPLMEALPLWLKLTGQRIVPADDGTVPRGSPQPMSVIGGKE